MSRKNVLEPIVLASNQSLATSFNSAPTVVKYLDNISYQINVVTTNSEGTFAVEVSNDYVPSNSGVTPDTGNWSPLVLTGTPTVAAANNTLVINMNQLPFAAIRLAYTSTVAGTGTCEIILTGKMI